MPSWTLLGSVTVVAIAVLGFLITASPDQTEQASGSALGPSPSQQQQQEPAQAEPTSQEPPRRARPSVPPQKEGQKKAQQEAEDKQSQRQAEKRAETLAEKKAEEDRAEKRAQKPDETAIKPRAYVEVFNNSGITGLAAQAAAELGGSGWDVVGTDDWYGDIPQSTVYYPERLRAQAELLADDLGTERILPSVEPMRFDRLTVILTGDL